MNIKITSVHFDADKKLHDFITNKLTKLTQFYDGITSVEVFLKLLNTQDQENKIVEIKVELPKKNELFAKRDGKSFEEAADQAVEAIRSQLIKFKEKLKS